MGMIPELVLDDWDKQQHADYQQSRHYTVVQLPCCGTSIETEVTQEGQEQLITCPNRFCGKRHLLSWGLNPKIQSELQLPEL
jgi:hypothetical protein